MYKLKAGRPKINPELKNKPVMISLPIILIDKLKPESNKSRLIQNLLLDYFKLN
jgi:hypothetical protein